MDVEVLAMILLVVGSILCAIGVIWFAIVAFRESVLWGLGCLFIPVVSFIFLIMHWRQAAKPFGVALLGQVIIVLGVLMLPFPGGAQGEEWRTLNDEAMSLYREGHYDRAIVVGKKALEVAEQALGPNHPDVAKSLENLAGLYRATNRAKEAEALEKRAEAIRAIKR